jgi:hypothetical protein
MNEVVANQESIIFINSDNFTNGNKALLDESIKLPPIIEMLMM